MPFGPLDLSLKLQKDHPIECVKRKVKANKPEHYKDLPTARLRLPAGRILQHLVNLSQLQPLYLVELTTTGSSTTTDAGRADKAD